MWPRFVVLCAAVLASVLGFAPSPSETPAVRNLSFKPMKRVASVPRRSITRVSMSADTVDDVAKLREQAQKLREEAAEAAGVSVEELKSTNRMGRCMMMNQCWSLQK